MAVDQSRYPFDRQVRELDRLHIEAQRAIAAQIMAAMRSGDLATAQGRRMQLAAVLAVLDQLGAAVDPMARRIIEDAVTQGAQRTAAQINAMAVTLPEIPGAFNGVAAEAVIALQDSITDRLSLARQTIGRQVADVYAREQRAVALRAVLGADPSPRAARRELARRLLRDGQVRRLIAQDGTTGFIDRAGRRWALSTYADMAVRTTTRQAVVQGQLARMAGHGITLARISDHGTNCDICRPWEGRLVSLDGHTTSYEGEAVATLDAVPSGGPPLHPNCKHSLQPVAVRLEQFARQLQEA